MRPTGANICMNSYHRTVFTSVSMYPEPVSAGNRPVRIKPSSSLSFAVQWALSHKSNAPGSSIGMDDILKRLQYMLTDFGGRPSRYDALRVKMSCAYCPRGTPSYPMVQS